MVFLEAIESTVDKSFFTMMDLTGNIKNENIHMT